LKQNDLQPDQQNPPAFPSYTETDDRIQGNHHSATELLPNCLILRHLWIDSCNGSHDIPGWDTWSPCASLNAFYTATFTLYLQRKFYIIQIH